MMDISKVVTFTEDSEPRDDKLMDLLKQAYKGEILCTMAIADISTIQPFSDYKVKISDDYRKYFKEQADDGDPLPLYVYTNDKKLIMSDNYNAFAMYQELNMLRVACVVVGETPKIDGVIYNKESFKLQPPKIEII